MKALHLGEQFLWLMQGCFYRKALKALKGTKVIGCGADDVSKLLISKKKKSTI